MSDSVSLLEARRLKRHKKTGSLKESLSSASCSPVSSTVSVDAIAKYNRNRKFKKTTTGGNQQNAGDCVASEPTEDQSSEETKLLNTKPVVSKNAEDALLFRADMEQAGVHRPLALHSSPPTFSSDAQAPENLVSYASDYSQASTVPVRSLSPVGGIHDLMSIEAENRLYPDLKAESRPRRAHENHPDMPRRNDNCLPGSDVDSAPDFGLTTSSNRPIGLDWEQFEGDLLPPPSAPSMEYIRQLLMFENPLPTIREVRPESLGSTSGSVVGEQNTEVKEIVGSAARTVSRGVQWKETETELFNAECDAEILYKMVS